MSDVLRKRAVEIRRTFEVEFVGRDRRTRDVPRLDALIAEMASIVERLPRQTVEERATLRHMRTERETILSEMKRQPARPDEIFISEPGARVNIYTRLHARAFRRDAKLIDIALLDEIADGLERALADLRARAPANAADWMLQNIRVAANAVDVCRQQRLLLDERFALPPNDVRDEMNAYVSDSVLFAEAELASIPESVARIPRARHLATNLLRLSPFAGDSDQVARLGNTLERRALAIESARSELTVDAFTVILESELETLDALFENRRTEARPDPHFSAVHHLIERAAAVALHVSELYNRTRSKRHDALALQSRRFELFVQSEASAAAEEAHRGSLH